MCFLFYFSPPIVWLHPLGVYVVLGPLANAAFGEGEKMATAVGSRRVLVNPRGHLVLAFPSISWEDLLEAGDGGLGWALTPGYLLGEELLVTPPLYKSMQ